MELWSALLIGLAGSLHCIGMCGPIAIALPTDIQSRWQLLLGRILYNIGRITTYSVLGFACGFIGQTIFLGGYQQGLSIALGVLILLSMILPSKYGAYITGAKFQGWIQLKLKHIWQKMMQKRSPGSLFVIGILNGFLPCGLVYIALAGSISTGSPVNGMFYMALFGAGTFPVMLAVSLVGKIIGQGVRRKINRLVPIGAVLLALLFIARGLSLGIPYISPKFETNEKGETTASCCDHKSPITDENIIDSTDIK